jgi:hypothetical protein
MAQYLYRVDGTRYEIEKITAKLVYYHAPGDRTHIIPRNNIKSDANASLRWSWYLQPPSWPTEGPLAELYAELRKLEDARDVARKAYNEASSRVWKIRNRIFQQEDEEERARRYGVSA